MGLREKEMTLRCECDCTQLRLVDCEDGSVSISFETDYLNKQNGRLRAIWNAIRSKETCYAEIICDKKDVVNFLVKARVMLGATKKKKIDFKVQGKGETELWD